MIKEQGVINVFAMVVHPVVDSLTYCLFDDALDMLSNNFNVIRCSLYDDNFESAMSELERRSYHDVNFTYPGLQGYIDTLLNADAIILSFPTWNGGPPAILKGFFDRVFKPGVTFFIKPNGSIKTLNNFSKIKYIMAINPHGGSYLNAKYMGDYSRKLVTRWLHWSLGSKAKVRYIGLYDINTVDDERVMRMRNIVRKEAIILAKHLSHLSIVKQGISENFPSR